MNFLKEISKNIWIIDGDTVSWYGMPYTTRTTIVRLENGDIWVHSPGTIADGLLAEMDQLGKVKHLVSPNKIHHLFMAQWIDIYPEALSYSSPGLSKKIPNIPFNKELQDYSEKDWKNEIDQMIFKGSSAMEEVVFFHRSSKTLILTDLIENFHPDHFSGFRKVIAKMTGIVSPNGKTPLDWRWSFIMGKKEARVCFEKMLAWAPEKIVIAHGECIFKDAISFLEGSFGWLKKSKT